MVAKAKAGPPPILERDLSAATLGNAITFCLDPEVQRAAAVLSNKIAEDNGPVNAVQSFYRHLPLETMRCQIASSELAVWKMKSKPRLLLSATTAAILLKEKEIRRSDLVV